MKKISVLTAVLIFLLLVAGNWAYAENKVSLTVSCTVPAIPGVNAPFLEQQIAIADPHPRRIEDSQSLEQNQQEQSAPVIKEETKGQNQDSEGELVLVKTFYVR
jgi:hypothetical protein